MDPLLTALVLALLVGITLGIFGAGGSILTLPIFTFVLGVPVGQAVAMSMVVVGGCSLPAAVRYWQKKNFHLRAAVLFSVSGALGAYAGSFLTALVSERTLLLIFAAIMLGAGIAMVRGRGENDQRERGCRIWPCLLIGATVGVLTGFLGVGGGFLIVPALVLFAGIDAKRAVGTSLAIISLNTVAGLAGQLRSTDIDWRVTLAFFALAFLGMLIGLVLSEWLPAERIRTAFGWFVIILALVIGGLSLRKKPDHDDRGQQSTNVTEAVRTQETSVGDPATVQARL
ncbi:membrane protein containing DUF81 [Rhodopirellula maiorica SM1]|uniref:Probable membrane transporter protein n=1 Tax=Rhodopirellula maiorica SM1 TaxID=1265738 RepID=M5S931_9BACT|nr:sulfite exporter TauE/SafE family protein [Rhodopirellula maiorica]EMI22679.1 membrane protein containing DUF81 [Rhodopirellula maiorica SM1]